MAILKEIKYQDWLMRIHEGDEDDFYNVLVEFEKEGEVREYTLDEIGGIEQKGEYVTLTHLSGTYTQIKFEEGNFLVIDLFDSINDEFMDSIGSHVFGED